MFDLVAEMAAQGPLARLQSDRMRVAQRSTLLQARGNRTRHMGGGSTTSRTEPDAHGFSCGLTG